VIPANHAVAGIAYGASLTTSEVLITGGSNATRHFANVWLISMESGKPTYRERPPLPVPVSQMAAAIVGRRVHVIGGIEMPNATTASPRHFSLDLDEVATAAGVGDALSPVWRLLAGCGRGRESRAIICMRRMVVRRRSVDAAARHAARSAAAASPAPVHDASVFIVSGDDGAQPAGGRVTQGIHERHLAIRFDQPNVARSRSTHDGPADDRADGTVARRIHLLQR
jgi:hypothetical protein